MIASDLISYDIQALNENISGEEALKIMEEFKVSQLPVVRDTQLLGVISEDQLIDSDLKKHISSFDFSHAFLFVHEQDHIFDILKAFAQIKQSLIPILDKSNKYLGVITASDLLHSFAESFVFGEPGAIVVLEMNKVDYSLAEIARIAENESCVIVHSAIVSHENNHRIELHLKFNKIDIPRVIAAFNRYDYVIKATFADIESNDSLKEHYESLVHYLNM